MNESYFKEAQKYLAGGVNSPVRAFGPVGGDPIFFERGEGPYLFDVNGKKYLDYVCSWGPLIAGHAHPAVIERVQHTVRNGLSFGAPTTLETQLARMVTERIASIERVRFVNSGTEATMSALRLARAATDRKFVVKFEGGYHGHVDSLLVAAGSGAATHGYPTSPGIPEELAALTMVLPYNDQKAVRQVFAQCGEQIAAVIVEPIAGNMGCIPPQPGFLETLSSVCKDRGALLILDEVMTGFRVAFDGAQGKYKIRPDLTTLGKIIGGGLPVGAFGGSASLMKLLAPQGPVYQAGTLAGNPACMAAGLETLKLAAKPGFYEQLNDSTQNLANGLRAAASEAGMSVQVNAVCGMFSLYFSDHPVFSYSDAKKVSTSLYAGFFHGMLEKGIYFAPSTFESGFLSSSHSESDIEYTIDSAREVMTHLKNRGS